MGATGVPRLDVEWCELVRRSMRDVDQRGLARLDKSELLLARRCSCTDQGMNHVSLGGLYAPACLGCWRSRLSI